MAVLGFPGLKWVRFERGKPGEFIMLGINENSGRVVLDFPLPNMISVVGQDIAECISNLYMQGWKEVERRDMHDSK